MIVLLILIYLHIFDYEDEVREFVLRQFQILLVAMIVLNNTIDTTSY